MESAHEPVMVKEVMNALQLKSDGIYADLTIDGAGHALALLQAAGEGAKLLGLDADKAMLRLSKARLKAFENQVRLVHANFAELKRAANQAGFEAFDGIFADLGFSSNQLSAKRGFSFMEDAPVDMRLNAEEGITARALIAKLSEKELADVIYRYGEERQSRPIAKALKSRLAEGGLKSSKELAETISRAVPKRFHPDKIHIATKTWQALRIAVNDELRNLEAMLAVVLSLLKSGGRLAILTYHSLEDRIVKHCFQQWAKDCICPPELPVCQCDKGIEAKIITKKPISPNKEEVEKNKRARSAKLRVAEKV